MRILNTLYVTDHRARISCRQSCLLVAGGDGLQTRVPLEPLEAVVLVGHAQVTSEALAACAERKVRLVSLRANGRIRYAVSGRLNGNVLLRMAQYRAASAPERVADIDRCIVAGKLQNARRLLLRWSWDAKPVEQKRLARHATGIADRIEALPRAASENSIRGFEGEGSRIYFAGLRCHLVAARVPFTFETRTRRPPRDPVNATLSFAYGLLLSEVAGALEAIGLDPQVGFLHGLRPGRPSLALDLLEELRPAVADRFVVGLLTRGTLKSDHFTAALGGTCYLTEEGRRTLLYAWEEFKSHEVPHVLLERKVPRGALPLIQAILFARHIRGDMSGYVPYTMDS